jgi:hypothetical protein
LSVRAVAGGANARALRPAAPSQPMRTAEKDPNVTTILISEVNGDARAYPKSPRGVGFAKR